MLFDMRKYSEMIKERDINIIYSGPLWDDGIKGIAEMVRKHLSHEEMLGNAAKNVFSVFIEQVTNVLMYSAEKESYTMPDKQQVEVPTGMLVLGQRGDTYFIQTGNAIKKESQDYIKEKIDYLNTLDKKELRKLHREQLTSDDGSSDSKGAGLGLIEIARRATAPIKYTFEAIENDQVYFTVYVELNQADGGRGDGI